MKDIRELAKEFYKRQQLLDQQQRTAALKKIQEIRARKTPIPAV